MKTTRTLLALALSFVAAASAGVPGTLNPTFTEILALPKGQAVIFTPVKFATGKSLAVHSFVNATAAVRPNGGARGVNVLFYGIKPDDSGVEFIEGHVIQTSPNAAGAGGGGGGAGKVSMHDISFSRVPTNLVAADGSVRLIAVALGYDVRATGADARAFPLPKELSITAQLDNGGTALLLPAVQKVREAASR